MATIVRFDLPACLKMAAAMVAIADTAFLLTRLLC
jgi:hypothetical protein